MRTVRWTSNATGIKPPMIAASPTVHAPPDAPLKALRAARANKLSALLLFAAVAAAPLPFGSTDPAAIAFWCIVLGAALVLASPSALRPSQFVLLGLAGIVVVAYGFVLHEQWAEHPWIALPHPLWREAAETLGVPLEPSVSIARNQPWFALGAPLAAMLSLMCGFIVCADRYRARRLFQVVAWSGVVYAVYGIVAHVTDPAMLLWREKQAYLTSVTGTFINRNTAAVYFGTCAIIWLLLLAEGIRQRLPAGPIDWKALPRRLLSNPPRKIIVAFAALFVCLAAMFMTSSRAGVVLSLMALILAFTMYFHRDLPSWSGRVTALIASGAVALVLLQFLGAGTSDRLDRQGLADGGRFETYRATWRMIADHPWFGTGQGTFAWSYPAYRSPNVSAWGVWDRAHSTLLEIAADVGLPLAGLVGVGWVIVFVVLVRGVRVRRRDLIVPAGGLSVAILAVSHSLIDFSLQIPGYAVPALAIVGAGLAQSFRNHARSHPAQRLD
jgi:O-antigen ligase